MGSNEEDHFGPQYLSNIKSVIQFGIVEEILYNIPCHISAHEKLAKLPGDNCKELSLCLNALIQQTLVLGEGVLDFVMDLLDYLSGQYKSIFSQSP